MSYSLTNSDVDQLLQIKSSDELTKFLIYLETQANEQWKWQSLGGRVANANSVELSTDPGPAIVERITNSIDAMLELRHSEMGSPDPGPVSPRNASEEWFGIQGGTLNRSKDGQAINSLSHNVRVDVFNSGQPKRPSISITDRGIGQHPNDFPLTILSLGASNKIGKSYLCGAYGQGGSATFMWCEYTIIVSRIRPELSNGRPDLVGWTVVRRYDDLSLKLNTYQYLVTEANEIPTFSPTHLVQNGFDYGTYIMHITYELGKLSTLWSIVGYRYLNNLLFDPVLPYTIHDHREPKPQDRYIYGSRGRLAAAHLEYSNEYVEDLGSNGFLTIRYWVFREKKEEDIDEIGESINSYLEATGSSRTIIITLNGQRHAYLDKSFVKSKTRYALLSDSLLVHVDCDQVSRQRKKGLFPATRSGLISGEKRLELIEDSVEKALRGDQELKRLEYERVQKRLATVDEDNERKVKRILDQLITISKPLLGPGADTIGGNGQVPSGQKPYKPKDPPTFFKFVDEKQVLSIQAGHKAVIDIITDGPNAMLTRKNRKAHLILECIGNQVVTLRNGLLFNGRMGVTVSALSDASSGATCQLRATLDMAGGVYFTSYRSCQIVAPPPPYIGVDPPTELDIKCRGNMVRLRRGKTCYVKVQTDCMDELLSRPGEAAHFEMRTSIPSIQMTARRGPHRGEVEAVLDVPDNVTLTSKEDNESITARLMLLDGTVLEDTKPCAVVEPPPPNRDEGSKRRPHANYKIIEVWREHPENRPEASTWEDLDWNEAHVGKYDLSRDMEDEDQLLLYINMDNLDLVNERERRLKRSGEAASRRLETRYQAYVGYHMWLHQQRSEKGIASTSSTEYETEISEDGTITPDGALEGTREQVVFEDEMRRVSKTVILAMRSEADLFAVMGYDDVPV